MHDFLRSNQNINTETQIINEKALIKRAGSAKQLAI